jgi:hypothetical protein
VYVCTNTAKCFWTNEGREKETKIFWGTFLLVVECILLTFRRPHQHALTLQPAIGARCGHQRLMLRAEEEEEKCLGKVRMTKKKYKISRRPFFPHRPFSCQHQRHRHAKLRAPFAMSIELTVWSNARRVVHHRQGWLNEDAFWKKTVACERGHCKTEMEGLRIY